MTVEIVHTLPDLPGTCNPSAFLPNQFRYIGDHFQAGLKGDARDFNITQCVGEITAAMGDIEARWKQHWGPIMKKRQADRAEQESDRRMRQIEKDRASRMKDRAAGIRPYKTVVTYLPEDTSKVAPVPASVSARLTQIPPAPSPAAPLPPELKRRGLVRRVAVVPSSVANTARES